MVAVLTGLLLLTATAHAIADDWPQWGGPQRDLVWRESGIVDTHPAFAMQSVFARNDKEIVRVDLSR